MNHEQAVAFVRNLTTGNPYFQRARTAATAELESAFCAYVADLADQAQALKQKVADLQGIRINHEAFDVLANLVPKLTKEREAWREYAGKLEDTGRALFEQARAIHGDDLADSRAIEAWLAALAAKPGEKL